MMLFKVFNHILESNMKTSGGEKIIVEKRYKIFHVVQKINLNSQYLAMSCPKALQVAGKLLACVEKRGTKERNIFVF